jgi:hypothetical protein
MSAILVGIVALVALAVINFLCKPCPIGGIPPAQAGHNA